MYKKNDFIYMEGAKKLMLPINACCKSRKNLIETDDFNFVN